MTEATGTRSATSPGPIRNDDHFGERVLLVLSILAIGCLLLLLAQGPEPCHDPNTTACATPIPRGPVTAVSVLGDRIAVAYPIALAVAAVVAFAVVWRVERRTAWQRYMDDMTRAHRRLDKATR